MKITLKAARINAGFLQKEVADKLGVSIHTITNWERGITKPKKHTLMVLASIYNIDINELKG